jgi:hypothetical protein
VRRPKYAPRPIIFPRTSGYQPRIQQPTSSAGPMNVLTRDGQPVSRRRLRGRTHRIGQ